MKLIIILLALNFALVSSQISKGDSVLERIEKSVSLLNLRLARIEARQTWNMIIYSRLEDNIRDVKNDLDSKHGETIIWLRNTVTLLNDLKMKDERSKTSQSVISENIQRLIIKTEKCCRNDTIVVACPSQITASSTEPVTPSSQSTTVSPATTTPTSTTKIKTSPTTTPKTTPTSTNTAQRKTSTSTTPRTTFPLTNTTSTSTPATKTSPTATSTSAIPFSTCDFEQTGAGGTCGFIQDNTDDFDWTRTTGETPSSGTGPTIDHTYGTTAGHYMYIESSKPHINGDTARLISRARAPAPSGHCLSFYYHAYGTGIKTLNVYKQGQQGQSVKLFSRTGSQGNQWILAQVTVTSSTIWDLVFEGIVGSSYRGDIAIDDITVYSKPCPVPGYS